MHTAIARELLKRQVPTSSVAAAARWLSSPSARCAVGAVVTGSNLPARLAGGSGWREGGGGQSRRARGLPAAAAAAAAVAAAAAAAADASADCSVAQADVAVPASALLQHSVGGESALRVRRVSDAYKFEGSVSLSEDGKGDTGGIVGTGNRSKVLTARHISTGRLVAVKQMSRRRSSQMQWEEEVRMMRAAQGHRNCIRLLDFMEDGDAFYIVMELAQGGELFRRLQSHGRFTEGEAARIMAEVLQAVEHLHSQGIVHFDIKPENIILRHRGEGMVPEVKLADFGSAFSKYHVTGSRDYTAAYSAPEVLMRCSSIDEKADIWSMGVLMYVLLSGRHPFDSPHESEIERRIVYKEPDFNTPAMRHVGPVAKDLLRRMMSKDRRLRPSAQEALSHAWFSAVAPMAPCDSDADYYLPRAQCA